MSMVCSALALDSETLERLRRDDELVLGATGLAYKRVLEETLDRHLQTRPEAERLAARQRRQSAEAEMLTRLPEKYIAEIEKSNALRERAAALNLQAATSLEKSWDAFQHLFERAGGSLFGGEPFGPDQGYGPALLRTPPEVATFAAFLGGPGADQVKDADMNWLRQQKLYAWPDDQASDVDLRDALNAHFETFRKYIQDAAHRGDALLIWIS